MTINQEIGLCDCASVATEAKYQNSFILMAQKLLLHLLVNWPCLEGTKFETTYIYLWDYLLIPMLNLHYFKFWNTATNFLTSGLVPAWSGIGSCNGALQSSPFRCKFYAGWWLNQINLLVQNHYQTKIEHYLTVQHVTLLRRRQRAFFWEGANGPSACCDADFSSASSLLGMSTLETTLYFQCCTRKHSCFTCFAYK